MVEARRVSENKRGGVLSTNRESGLDSHLWWREKREVLSRVVGTQQGGYAFDHLKNVCVGVGASARSESESYVLCSPCLGVKGAANSKVGVVRDALIRNEGGGRWEGRRIIEVVYWLARASSMQRSCRLTPALIRVV